MGLPSVEHGVAPVTKWLSKYIFKDWNTTATNEKDVTLAMKKNGRNGVLERSWMLQDGMRTGGEFP